MANTPGSVPARTTQIRNKIDDIELITLQQVTVAPRVIISTELDVTNLLSVDVFIYMGRQTTSAFTASLNFRIESTAKPSGDGFWIPITSVSTALGSSVASQAVNGTVNSGQKVITIANTTGFAVGDIVFINNTTLSNSEFGRITAVSANVSITLEDNLVNAQTGSTVYNQSERFHIGIDSSSIKRLRVVSDGAGAAQNYVVYCEASVGA